MKRTIFLTLVSIATAMLLWSCSGDQKSKKLPAEKPTNAKVDSPGVQASPAQTDRYYVLDKKQGIVFEIDLKTNKVTQRLTSPDKIVAVAYDGVKDWVYEAIGGSKPGLRILDPKQNKVVNSFDFAQPPSDILFHPVKRQLYIASADSTYFRIFSPDSMKTVVGYPLWVTGAKPVGPRVMSPGPANRLYTANGERASVSVLLTDPNYAYQTVIVMDAKCIDNAVSSFDGNSAYCCDRRQGKIYRVEFGTGDVLAQKEGLDNPRLIQFEVNSQTVVLVTGKSTVLMLNPDTFVETGKVDLSKYGDEILSLFVPPKANYAELTLDYKGVTRWLRLDIRTWQPMRLVELY